MTLSGLADARRWRMPGTRADMALHYGASTTGLAAVSAAHFLASLILLHALPAGAFGLFSFVMVVAGFGMSLNVALISVPITRALAAGDTTATLACFQMNWLVCGGFAVLLFGVLLACGAALPDAAVLALFAGIFTFRWFARCFAYVEGRTTAALQSDLIYALLLAASLGWLAAFGDIDLALGGEMLLLSALAGLMPFGASFFRRQFAAAFNTHPKHYGPIFRDVGRWSLTGVVTTELTANAHAYLVTFLFGADAFAPLALGMLLLRPASLMQSALPDLERPRLARAIAVRDQAALSRIRRHFTLALLAAWIANLLLVAAVLLFFPALVVKGNSIETVALVAGLCAVIMAVRALRTPQAVLLQAAGAFKSLAGISTLSAMISLAATLSLLLVFGPIASLGGILLGELMILMRCHACLSQQDGGAQ